MYLSRSILVVYCRNQTDELLTKDTNLKCEIVKAFPIFQNEFVNAQIFAYG